MLRNWRERRGQRRRARADTPHASRRPGVRGNGDGGLTVALLVLNARHGPAWTLDALGAWMARWTAWYTPYTCTPVDFGAKPLPDDTDGRIWTDGFAEQVDAADALLLVYWPWEAGSAPVATAVDAIHARWPDRPISSFAGFRDLDFNSEHGRPADVATHGGRLSAHLANVARQTRG